MKDAELKSLAEGLTVVGQHDGQALLKASLFFERGQQLTHMIVGTEYFGVVATDEPSE